jgi:hypothetical protein
MIDDQRPARGGTDRNNKGAGLKGLRQNCYNSRLQPLRYFLSWATKPAHRQRIETRMSFSFELFLAAARTYLSG